MGRVVTTAEYLDCDDFPEHIKHLVQREKESEEQEKRQREIERNTCKVHPPPVDFPMGNGVGHLTECSVVFHSGCIVVNCSISLSDQAVLHASGEDDGYDGEQAGSAQGQDAQRGNRDGLQGTSEWKLNAEESIES